MLNGVILYALIFSDLSFMLDQAESNIMKYNIMKRAELSPGRYVEQINNIINNNESSCRQCVTLLHFQYLNVVVNLYLLGCLNNKSLLSDDKTGTFYF